MEEVVIPHSENTPDDDELDDVIPCEPVEEVAQNVPYEVVDSSNDGFYDDVGYTPTMSIDQMVDISSVSVSNSGNELEEVMIPNSESTSNDNELDDVTPM